MSASFADYDNDGRLDIYVTRIRSSHAWFAEPPTVWRYMVNSWRQGVWATDMPLYLEIFRQPGVRFVDVFRQMASGNTLLGTVATARSMTLRRRRPGIHPAGSGAHRSPAST